MNSKRFEYTHKDIPYLKKDIVFNTTKNTIFCANFTISFLPLLYAFSTLKGKT